MKANSKIITSRVTDISCGLMENSTKVFGKITKFMVKEISFGQMEEGLRENT